MSTEEKETPEQKALRLGVPIRQAIHWPTLPVMETNIFDKQDFLKMRKPDAICGGCGKEIFNGNLNAPCGRNDCPFGYITFQSGKL